MAAVSSYSRGMHTGRGFLRVSCNLTHNLTQIILSRRNEKKEKAHMKIIKRPFYKHDKTRRNQTKTALN